MPDERQPRRRNVRPELASLRGRVASMTYRGAPADQVEAARAALRSAKARATVRDLLPLPAAERQALAELLLKGAGDAAA